MKYRSLVRWLAVAALVSSCTPPSPVAAPSTSGEPAPTLAASAEPAPAAAPPRIDSLPIWRSASEVQTDCAAHIGRATSLRETLAGVENAPTVDTALGPMNEILLEVDRVMGMSELMAAVHPDKAVRDAAEICQQDAQKFVNELKLDRRIYDVLVAVKLAGLPPDAKRFTERLLRDYRRAGVDRDEPTRKLLAELQEEIVKVGQSFSRAIREDKRAIAVAPAELAGLPKDFLDKHPAGKDGKVRITTDTPDLLPLLSYATKEKVRQALWLEFVNRAYPQNEPTLKKLLELRYRYATTLGYPDWASYNAGDKMLADKAQVSSFIDRVADIARPRMQRELADLLARKQQDDRQAKTVREWDRQYYVGKLQKERYGVDSQLVRGYFDYPRVKEGVLGVAQALFGVTFRRLDDAPVWHPKVEAYEVIEQGQPIARFYLDMHPRDDKYGHAAAFGILSGVRDRQLPNAALVCNFPEPSPGGPALMEHREVVTFFHEFGHLMHNLLSGRHRWITAAAFNVEWDFVEVPSQLLEEWAWHPDVLGRFAVHHETGQPIPRELCDKMRKADEFGKGVHVMRQMWLAALSLHYYDRPAGEVDLLGMDRQIHERYSPYPFEEGTHFFANFGHLEGYSSTYYTYMWSLVLVKDIFTKLEQAGLFDPAVTRAYRQAILEPGASRDAADMVHTFLGRPYAFDAFRRWLEKD